MTKSEVARQLPDTGIILNVHARVPMLCDRAQICFTSESERGALNLHVFNWTGHGLGGYHYDPLIS
eukprot:3020155-Karenia_brevis.AAC.1